MYTLQATLKDRVYTTGLIMILLSLFIFCIPFMHAFPEEENVALFFGNFLFTAVYGIVLMINRGKGTQRRSLLLILFLISAYSLNRDLHIFQTSVPWFAAVLVSSCICFVLFAVFDVLPAWAQYLLCFLLGIAFAVFVYLSIYLVPLYAFSAVAAFVLGISLHSFVPALFCLHAIAIMRYTVGNIRRVWLSFGAGAGVVLIIAVIYTICWCTNMNKLNAYYKADSLDDNSNVPSWVSVAAAVPLNLFTEKILKTELVYNIADVSDFQFWGTPSRNFGAKQHDPLVMTASLFSGPVRIPEQERVKILECMFDSRHQGQERLWSGDGLMTDQVTAKIQLWPQQRFSYTELSVIVSQLPDRERWWRNRQEAIYTFHLPEGGVVTSLSLWINGKEEKGLLTTKAKADSAYKTIVGVEARDPSVVHWQEGNTVTVRVFPVTLTESRKFKIGITAPMTLRNDQLIYENIGFQGPPTDKATQQITINNNGRITERKGAYESEWGFSVPATRVTPASFSFDGSIYTILPYQQETVSFSPAKVYLDINAAWSFSELQQVWQLVKDKQVFVAGGRSLGEHNLRAVYDERSQNSFSLFPFYEITDDAALVITKNNRLSPSLADLKGSPFMNSLKSYFMDGHRVKVFDLGRELSPYLKTLKEFRGFDYIQGNIQQLQGLLATHTYQTGKENNDQVNIDNAQLTIRRTVGSTAEPGTDHIMRLFTYNHILQRSGAGLLEGAVLQPELIAEAQKAYVVSPVSSLVVLETQADYDRFNIDASKNSLQNASVQSNGSVPEPHEWALIILVLLTLFVLKYRPRWIVR